ncbi:helix-turn-helix domain-containing protein [Streptomyces caatingaensis]|uniref:helix-turn-helix domain-containing protein n=1 Tax=Streptomyces caatingaensis TaxID=1678637 RepID=UPI003BAEBCFF
MTNRSNKAARDHLRFEMTAAGCTTADIALEMRARFRLRPREAWRHAHGWTMQEAADRLNDAGTREGQSVAADASLVGKWEKWPGPSGRRPTLAVLAALSEVFGCGLDQLLDFDDRRAMPETERLVLSQITGPAPETPAPTPVQRREPVGAELLHVAAEESAAWAAWAEATNVGDIAVEQLMADTRALSEAYLTGDPARVFARTRRLRDRAFGLLEGRQHPRQASDLYVVAGYLCTLLAWMSSDLGQLRDAETHGRTAWLCAELAGHPELSAWVLSTRSKVAFWDSRLRDAVNHARRGAAGRPRGTVAVLLASQEADAWSELGAVDEARAALLRARGARDQLSAGEDEIGGLFSCPEVRRANYSASVLTRVGDAQGALAEADQALHSQPAHSYGTAAQIHIARASALLLLASPDGAAEAVAPVLSLPPEHRLEPVMRRMRDLASTVARSRWSTARPAARLQEEIDAWCMTTAPRLLALSPGGGAG